MPVMDTGNIEKIFDYLGNENRHCCSNKYTLKFKLYMCINCRAR